MLSPRDNYHMKILGFGTSVATPPEGITAEVVVVETFDELAARGHEVPGKVGGGSSVNHATYSQNLLCPVPKHPGRPSLAISEVQDTAIIILVCRVPSFHPRTDCRVQPAV